MHAKAQALKDQIDSRFPVGTPRSRFMEFARTRAGWQADAGSDHFISIGQEPSRVWILRAVGGRGLRAVQGRPADRHGNQQLGTRLPVGRARRRPLRLTGESDRSRAPALLL